jgi:hypothetical protein
MTRSNIITNKSNEKFTKINCTNLILKEFTKKSKIQKILINFSKTNDHPLKSQRSENSETMMLSSRSFHLNTVFR